MDKFPGITSNETCAIKEAEDKLTVKIPSTLGTKRSVIEYIGKALLFPSYFNINLDSLSDCLRDLSWITEKCVVLIFEDVSDLDHRDLDDLFSLLSFCVLDWERTGEKKLRVVAAGFAKPQPRSAD